MRKITKTFLALLMIAALFSGGLSAALAEAPTVYKLGDKAADFTVTLSDGQETSLYGLLQEKKVVLLNFWASWCGPCQMEFPYLQEVYDQLADDLGVIALTIEAKDTDQSVEQFKEEVGVTTLPLGRDTGLAAQYGVSAYPTTIIIDRNGVICLIHEGMITSSQILLNALQPFLAEDYDHPVLLEEMPQVPITEAAGGEALTAALNAEGGALTFLSMESDQTLWPFVPSPEGTSAIASNAGMQGTTSNLVTEIEAKAGDVLTYELRMVGTEYEDRLVAFVDSNAVTLHSGTLDWDTHAIRFDQDGLRQVAFAYVRGYSAGYDAVCELRNFRLLTGEEAAAYEFPVSDAPKTLDASEVSIDFINGDSLEKVMSVLADGSLASDEVVLYVANADSVATRLRVGADVDEHFAAVTVSAGLTRQHTIMLGSLEHDEEGYLYTVPLDRASGITVVTLKSNVLDDTAPTASIMLSVNEQSAKTYFIGFMSSMMEQLTAEQIQQMDYFALGYQDGTVILEISDVIAAMGMETEAPASLSTTITFTDREGKPIQNVMAQICDDTTCTVLPSDENGVVRFEGENRAYELHVLMAPAGYLAPEGTVALPVQGGEVSIVLETAAE